MSDIFGSSFILTAKQNSVLPDVTLGNGRGGRLPKRQRWTQYYARI